MSAGQSGGDWRPTCTREALAQRAAWLAAIRRFFAERGVLEVETPLLGQTAPPDPHLRTFVTHFRRPGTTVALRLFLQSSPEFAMKRLLAAGSGSIFQICKAFRNEEWGRLHNPEFTLLEWYRVGFSLPQLMDEIAALLAVLGREHRALQTSERWAYADIFTRYVGVDPLDGTPGAFAARARALGLPEAEALCGEDRSLWLDLLFSHVVQPQLGHDRLCFVHAYPAILPSLARRHPQDPRLVERVEVFWCGIELGNGFHELSDAAEQEARFDADLARRRSLGLPAPPKDQRLLDALQCGLPDCSGVAIGLDRLFMLLLGKTALAEVLTFPVERA
ncbi:EF-P lysine aminoacylase EpmA [Candidatus Methylocalor cossyra]|uniref:Elongation factor P--(R)-beta-lysine ligase n=1 Tax=Candidatus Methylocalor cossyra TaxID=3108543 RepID=A0ABM9NH50_9GAMM